LLPKQQNLPYLAQLAELGHLPMQLTSNNSRAVAAVLLLAYAIGSMGPENGV